MQIMTQKVKYLGKTFTLFQVVDAVGEVLQVLETRAEAEAWMGAQ